MTDSAFRVLLVEDNDDHAELIRRTLGEHQIGRASCRERVLSAV